MHPFSYPRYLSKMGPKKGLTPFERRLQDARLQAIRDHNDAQEEHWAHHRQNWHLYGDRFAYVERLRTHLRMAELVRKLTS